MNKSNLTITGARAEKPSVTSPRGDKHSVRIKDGDDDYMIVSLAILIVTKIIRPSKQDEFDSSLKSEGRMIWKIGHGSNEGHTFDRQSRSKV